MLGVAACAHAPPPATCGARWTALSTGSATRSDTELDRKPYLPIRSVSVKGVDEPLASTLLRRLETREGMWIGDAPLREDLKRLWTAGVLADARVELDDMTDVVFHVTPRAAIRRVVVEGGDAAMARRFHLLAGAQFEPSRITRMTAALELAYVRDGRVDASITAHHATVPGGVEVCVAANPGPRVTIGSLTFPGNLGVPEAKLVAAIKGEKGKVNHVGGTLDTDALVADRPLLESEYWQRGFAEAKIGHPQVVRRGNRLAVAIPIAEGAVFRLGKLVSPVDITELAAGDVFNYLKIHEARDKLRERIGATDIVISTHADRIKNQINISFDIHWRWPWDVLRHWRLRPS